MSEVERRLHQRIDDLEDENRALEAEIADLRLRQTNDATTIAALRNSLTIAEFFHRDASRTAERQIGRAHV